MSQVLSPSLPEIASSHETPDRLAREFHYNAFGRLACPFYRVYPDEQASRTCIRGSPDIRHVKEHLKKHHKCDCSSSGRAAACRNRLHLTPDQQTSIYRNRRRQQEEPGEQWIRIFQQMFPDATTVPAPHLIPSGLEYLVAVTRLQPPGLTELLRSRMSTSRVPEGPEHDEVKDLYRHSRMFLETVLRSPHVLQSTGRNTVAAGAVDTQHSAAQVVDGAFETGLEITIEPHEKVSKWIDEAWEGELGACMSGAKPV